MIFANEPKPSILPVLQTEQNKGENPGFSLQIYFDLHQHYLHAFGYDKLSGVKKNKFKFN